ncbi:BON domain-containing protein [Caballeronia sp. LjRoot34]|uniref:BON domain-containing protein n=1 Tax=Caballeronia sp. LjRoot34 TaxID=3342325 RepID=UPI003ECEF5A0
MKVIKLNCAAFAVVGMLAASWSCAQGGNAVDEKVASTSAAAMSSRAKAAKAANRALARKVLKALVRTKGIDATRIFVKAVDGDITLSGTVPSEEQTPLAIKTAQAVEGVKSVRDVLRLSTQPTE